MSIFVRSTFLSVVVFFLLMTQGVTSVVHAADQVIPASEDTSVYGAFPDHVDGSFPWLWVGYGPEAKKEQAVIQFPLSVNGTPVSLSTVTGAKLRVYIIDEDNHLDSTLYSVLQRSHELSVQAAQTGTWSESSLTGKQVDGWSLAQPPQYTTVAQSTARKTWVELDVTNVIQKQAASNPSQVTLIIKDDQASAGAIGDIAFASKNYTQAGDVYPASYAPQLVLTTGGAQSGLQSDLDNDGDVDIFDYNSLLGDFGKTGAVGFIKADIVRNGAIDIFDYNVLLGDFGKRM